MCLLTCPRVCAVDLWLCGVPEHHGSHTVEAVFIGVILQSRLLRAHHVVLVVTSAHYQLRNAKLLLQRRESRAIACRARNRGEHKPSAIRISFTCHNASEEPITISVAEQEALALFGWWADPLLKVRRVSDVEDIVDVHGQCKADVVVVAPVGGAGDHGAH